MSLQKELFDAMSELGQRPGTLFLGQSVLYPGTRMHETFEGVPQEKKIEMPVAEDFQLGLSIGLSLEGFLPVSVFPRMNFLLCAANQLVNHLDRIPIYSDYKPKVIVRTATGASKPLDPGPQHQDDFSEPLQAVLRAVKVVRLADARSAFGITPGSIYYDAAAREGSTIVVEDGNAY